MTSTVTQYSSLIDETFPVAGQTNDTQGFRDNFAAIKNAFTATSNEINNLQINVSSLTDQSTSIGALSGNIDSIHSSITDLTAQINSVAQSSMIPDTLNVTGVNATGTITAKYLIGDGSGITGLSIPDPTNLSSLTVNGNGTITGNLTVTGSISASSITGSFNAGQSASIANFIQVGGLNNTIIGATTPAAATFTDVHVNKSLNVKLNLTANLLQSPHINITGNKFDSLNVKGGGKITGGLQVGGTITASNITINGSPVLTIATADLSTVTSGISALSGLVQSVVKNFKDWTPITPNTGFIGPTLTVDYTYGRYQKFIVDPTGNSQTVFHVSNWPASGNIASIAVEFNFLGNPSLYTNSYIESRSACTTNGASGLYVDITDQGTSITPNVTGVGAIKKNWNIFSTNPNGTPSGLIATVAEVISNTKIKISQASNFVSGTEYYFAPPQALTSNYYDIDVIAPSGTLKVNQNIKSKNTINVLTTPIPRIVYNLYSYDSGATVFLRNIEIY